MFHHIRISDLAYTCRLHRCVPLDAAAHPIRPSAVPGSPLLDVRVEVPHDV